MRIQLGPFQEDHKQSDATHREKPTDGQREAGATPEGMGGGPKKETPAIISLCWEMWVGGGGPISLTSSFFRLLFLPEPLLVFLNFKTVVCTDRE